MKNSVNHSEFKLENYIPKTYRFGDRVFDFKDDRIDKLPFIKGKILELRDSSFPEKGYNLILRITPTQKTFYVKTPNKSLVKLGVWKKRTDSRLYEEGKLCVSTARGKAKEHFEKIKYSKLDAIATASMTIKEYLENGHYNDDRTKFPTKSNKIKPISERAVKTILHGARSILDFKISDVDENWLELFREDWNSEYTSKGNNKPTVKSKDTQRKYFTVINAMINIWVTAGYVIANPISDKMSSFLDEAKSMNKREVLTIDEVTTDELVDYIVNNLPEDTPREFHGKIVLSTMALTGARNCEIYRNFARNWNFKNRSITILGEIIKKTNDTRTIPVEHDGYWSMMKRYFAKGHPFYYETDENFLLPNADTNTGHAAEGCTGEVWKKVREKFGIPMKKRAYDLRHTFANNLRNLGEEPAQIAYYLGDEIQTVSKYYFQKNPEAGRDTIRQMHQSQHATANSNELIEVDELFMPKEIHRVYGMFKSGKVIDGKMRSIDYQKFLELIQSMPEQTTDSESQLWLKIQAA